MSNRSNCQFLRIAFNKMALLDEFVTLIMPRKCAAQSVFDENLSQLNQLRRKYVQISATKPK